jgi:hypothetical protein
MMHEGDLNLRDTTRSGRNLREIKFTKQVVFGASVFTFVDLDEDTRWIVGVCREDFGLFGQYSSVTLDKSGHDTSGLNRERGATLRRSKS